MAGHFILHTPLHFVDPATAFSFFPALGMTQASDVLHSAFSASTLSTDLVLATGLHVFSQVGSP